MQEIIEIRGQSYVIKDCGGSGSCLFKCLAQSISKLSHRRTRHQIVNYVVENWEVYEQDVLFTLFLKTPLAYALCMRNSTEFGSSVECRAASSIYNTRILVSRKVTDKNFFLLEYLPENFNNRSLEIPTVHLLFTGHHQENDRTGHYQILEEISNIQNNENPMEEESFQETFTVDVNFSNIMIEENDNTEYTSHGDNFNFDENFEVNFQESQETLTADENSSSNTILNNENNRTRYFSRSIKNNKNVRGKKKAFRKCCKEMILKTKRYFTVNKKKFNISNVNLATAKCLGISKVTVVRVSKEAIFNGGFIEDAKFHNSGRKKIILEEFYQAAVRRLMQDFYRKFEFPTVKALHAKLKDQFPDFPTVTRHILRCALKSMKFKYKKFNKKPVLMESTAIKTSRLEYLRKIKQFRNEQRKIYYLDETWCGATHTRKFGWIEELDSTRFESYDHYRSEVQQVFGERGGFVTPTGPGKRVIILHIGSEDGFLNGAMDCFVGQTGCNDYHKEMNALHFCHWFKNMLLLLPLNSVVVLDKAPYHTMLDSEFRNTTTKWNKAYILLWIDKRGIPLPNNVVGFHKLTVKNLLKLCKDYRYEKKYELEKIKNELRPDVELLWLPVAHCEFNPIELIWAYVKNRVAKENKTFKLHDVHQLCIQIMNDLPPNLWKNCVKHAIKYENYYRIPTPLADSVQPLIINTTEDNSDEDDESYDEFNVSSDEPNGTSDEISLCSDEDNVYSDEFNTSSDEENLCESELIDI